MSKPEILSDPSEPAGTSGSALVVVAFVLPALHPLLRAGGVGVASHLLWLVHVLPVALVAYRSDRRWGGASVAASMAVILIGERLLGAGYGRPAPWETAISLALGVGFAETLVVAFARYARNARDRQARSAVRDALTGLPNRRGLEAAVRETARTRPEDDHGFALLFLDLDRFKRINDSLGHSVGDEVLRSVAGRLQRGLRPGDLLARVGGDEFVALLPDLDASGQAVEVGRRLVEGLADEPVEAAGHRIHVDASAGVATRRSERVDPEAVLRDAATALRRAKESPARDVVRFRTEMSAAVTRRLELETELQEALDAEQLRLHFQPVFAARGAELRGAEALLRWEHPERGLIPPGEFLPVVREAGLTVPVGSWVIEEASRRAATWGPEVAGDEPFVMSVNVDAPHFSHRVFPDVMRAAVERARAGGARLEVEITEQGLMSEGVGVEERLEWLAELGASVAIDDFGTGYSSLRYLHTYPVDVLKIDRSFVCTEGSVRCEPAISETILALAASLGLETVAEGIETSAQHEELRAQGADYVQGYLFGRPVPAPAFREAYLGAGKRPAVASAR